MNAESSTEKPAGCLGIKLNEGTKKAATLNVANQMCVPLTIALCPALLATSALQPCRNAILLLSVSPSALLLPPDINPVEMQFFYSQLKGEHTTAAGKS